MQILQRRSEPNVIPTSHYTAATNKPHQPYIPTTRLQPIEQPAPYEEIEEIKGPYGKGESHYIRKTQTTYTKQETRTRIKSSSSSSAASSSSSSPNHRAKREYVVLPEAIREDGVTKQVVTLVGTPSFSINLDSLETD